MSATRFSIRASEFNRGSRGCRSNTSAPSASSSACSRASGRSGSALPIVMGASFAYKKKLGLYGQLFDSGVGIAGVGDLPVLAVHGDLRIDRRAVRSAWPGSDHEGRAARRDRTAIGPGLPFRRRQAGPRRVQPHGLRQPDRADHRAGGDGFRADGRHHARPACRLLWRQDRHGAVLPRQSRAGLPGHPAVLPAGDARHHGHADPLRHGRAVLPVPDHLLQRAVLDALQEPARPALHPARPDADCRRLDLCRPGLRRRSVRHHPYRSEPAQHLRGGGVRLQPRRVPHRARPGHGHQDARLRCGGADARRNARGTSCCGKSCPTRAGR